ncbi:MAG: TolC family outer membrane protein [Magnetococcales bacterium]|nr:TolC family outer membrane protein [Magnetococcales bacterium]
MTSLSLFRVFAAIALGLSLSPLTELKAQTLQEAVGIAMASNPKVLAAISDYHAWDQRINQAFAGFLPKIDLHMGTGREWTSSPTTRAIEGGYALDRGELGLSINQILFDGLNTFHRFKQAEAQARSSEAGLQDTINKVTQDTVEIYLETLKQMEILEVNDEAIRVLEQIVKKMEALAQIGMGTDIEANQSRSRLVLARSERTTTLRKLQDAEARFTEITGSAPVDLTFPDISTEMLPGSLEKALNLAWNKAPAIEVSQAELEAAEAEKKMSISSLLPKVNLEMNMSDNANISGTRSYTKSASAMFTLEYNLFKGGSDWAHNRETANRMYQSQEKLEQARRQLAKEVSSAWHTANSEEQQVQLMEQHLLVQEQVAAAYQQEYALGTRSHLDALNALNDVFSAKRNLVEERYKRLLSNLDLLSSMGVLAEVMAKADTVSSPIFSEKNRAPPEDVTATHRDREIPLSDLAFPSLLEETVAIAESKMIPLAFPMKGSVTSSSNPDFPFQEWDKPATDSLIDYVEILEGMDRDDMERHAGTMEVN